MAELITCPVCQSRVALEGDDVRALCGDCHDMSEEQLAEELQKRVDRAVWAALRAVEDQAAYVRWAADQGKQVPPDAEDSEQSAALLRRILQACRRRAADEAGDRSSGD